MKRASDRASVQAAIPAEEAAELRRVGPDGTGPYRVTAVTEQGYTTEVFIPRSLFAVPVFCPGWYVGFDCAVGVGAQPGNNQFKGQVWATGQADNPDRWGDLLLLGTDPYITIQEADGTSSPATATAVIPGYSYLVTVIDPDRNVNPGEIDSVIVSAEVKGGHGDVEVFVLNETDKNTGVFRGYINTQPGIGRQVQAVVEVLPLQEVVLGYVDVANARGQRNTVTEMRLPVLAPAAKVNPGNGRP